jgi:hypothetical protein
MNRGSRGQNKRDPSTAVGMTEAGEMREIEEMRK